MADNYDGPATIHAGKASVDVTVHIMKVRETSGLGSWEGTIDPGPDLWDFQGDTCRLHLPDGGEGDIIITNMDLGTTPRPARFTGSGEPPY